MTEPNRSLHEVIESTVELAAHRMPDDGVSLNCRIHPGCRSVFAFDPWCVTQLVTNLLSNALQYTVRGSVKVDVDCAPVADGTRIKITIVDTGPGISDDIQKIMFASPDQRELMPQHEEVGLGIIISQQLCEMMGATLDVESRLGEGTRVTVQGRLSESTPDTRRAGTLTDALRNTQALIVDTDLSARRLLEAHLRSWGIEVRSVLDVASAIERVVEATTRNHAISMVFINQDTPCEEVELLVDELQHSDQHRDAMLVMTGSDLSTSRIRTTQSDRFGITLGSPVRPSALFDCVAQHPFVQSQVVADAGISENGSVTPAERRVLLVEDNIVNQCVASEILKRIGVSVDIANNGLEALQMLVDNRYDFVFMDCQMPEMDGFEATREIRKQEALRDLPVVALTANALSGDRQSCLDAGMSDYLTKPFTRDQLQAILDKWTTGRIGDSEAAADGSTGFTGTALINQSALDEIRALDNNGESTIFDEIIGEYMTSSSALIRDIDRAITAGSCEEVARCTHALKSSSAAVGLSFFGEQCARLEALAQADDLARIVELWTQAEVCYQRSVDQLSGLSGRRVA